MKKLSLFAVAALTVANIASAVYAPGWERPIMGGPLDYIAPTKPVPGLKAMHLVLNQRDEAKEPTSFTLTEDTGIRCVTTPCPSSKETQFDITRIRFTRRGVEYEAVEVLKNIPPHVRIARRTLTVVESDMEIVVPGGGGFAQLTYWDVVVKGFAAPADHYTARPEAIFTAQ